MVEKIDTHDVASLLDALRQSVVFDTRKGIVARMIVAKCKNRSICKYGFADDDAHIDGRFADASVRQFHALDEFEVLVHE